MIVRAIIDLLAAFHPRALLDLKLHGVVLELLPTVALCTALLQLAAAFVIHDILLLFPVGTCYWVIAVLVRLSPVVLPVVGVNAEGLIVLRDVEWASFGLEEEHIEVLIVVVVMKQFDINLLLGVREGAVLPILTLIDVVGVVRAELFLVSIGPVKLLNPVMCAFAKLAVGAHSLVVLLDIFAELIPPEVPRPLPVVPAMIPRTLPMAVLNINLALVRLKVEEIQALDFGSVN